MIKIKSVTSYLYDIDNLKDILLKNNKDKNGQFRLPENGDYFGFTVNDVQTITMDSNYRQNEYLISEFKGELNIISLENNKSKDYIKVDIDNKIYKFGIPQLNAFLKTDINIKVYTQMWRLQDMINEALFNNIVRIDY